MSNNVGFFVLPERETIGERIRLARMEAGLSQAQLGACIGTPRTAGVNVSNWETGVKKPDLRSIYRLARALDVDVKILLGLS